MSVFGLETIEGVYHHTAGVAPGAPVFSGLVRAANLDSQTAPTIVNDGWSLSNLRGRLIELSALEASASLTLTCTLILEAQRIPTLVTWIYIGRDSFFPPDMAANGVELSDLTVVRVPDAASAGRAADWLLRSRAFGLLIADLGRDFRFPAPLQARLAQLCRRQGAVLLFLTVKPDGAPSLGSLVSLHARAFRQRIAPGLFRCSLSIIKDKRRAPGWKHTEEFCGPPGLC